MFQEVRQFQSTGKPLFSELFAQRQGVVTPISQSLTGALLAGVEGEGEGGAEEALRSRC